MVVYWISSVHLREGGGEEKKLSRSVGFLLFSSFFWVFVVVCVIGSSWQEKEGAPKGAQLQGW